MLQRRLLALEFLLLGLVIGVLVAPRSGWASRQLLIDKVTEMFHRRSQ